MEHDDHGRAGSGCDQNKALRFGGIEVSKWNV